MIIKNGLVFTGTEFTKQDMYIDNLKIVSQDVSSSFDQDTIDADGLYVIPGLIDIHFHGCMGQDFSNGTLEALETISNYEASQGITSICPASMTLPVEQISQICKIASKYSSTQSSTPHKGATLNGIHLEGPFLSKEKKGAQNENYLMQADLDIFHQWQQEAQGLIKLISVAPEYPENMEFIRHAREEVSISLAHSTADYETAMEAFGAGANHVTHLFNAMEPLSHRKPGIPGAAQDAKAFVELICDGIHIHPSMIRAAFSIYGEDKIILISDSMEATGMPDGTYSLGGQTVIVKGHLATLQDGTIAGSATNLMDCVRYLVKEVGIPLKTAIKCATVNPAKSIGIYGKYGSLDIGKIANFVLLDTDLNLHAVYINGTKIK